MYNIYIFYKTVHKTKTNREATEVVFRDYVEPFMVADIISKFYSKRTPDKGYISSTYGEIMFTFSCNTTNNK